MSYENKPVHVLIQLTQLEQYCNELKFIYGGIINSQFLTDDFNIIEEDNEYYVSMFTGDYFKFHPSKFTYPPTYSILSPYFEQDFQNNLLEITLDDIKQSGEKTLSTFSNVTNSGISFDELNQLTAHLLCFNKLVRQYGDSTWQTYDWKTEVNKK